MFSELYFWKLLPCWIQTVSSDLCPPGPHIWSCKPHWTNATRFLFSQGFEIRRERTIRWWSVDNSVPRFYLNIPHFRKHISRNNAKLYRRLLRHTRSVLCVLADISVLEKGILNAEPDLLQQSCNKYRPFSFNAVSPCLPITPFHGLSFNVSLSVPMCALKSPKTIIDFVDPTFWRTSLTSSTKA